ncbi:hypothetical protein P7L53_00245 [Thermoleptolyngbya sichuanensis XZ-Cy5]|uniref:hypothetical protein n=1 Tax=Thermoleptolyngbya sichuanensis TaxID=2885951 RepID=UPI00240D3D99|nr:hypothetical protein [Thermoleptolyngbya sichuanensis]MDG2614661.1 hypothetical protein [Thermoleptolyngbya sichuanensis XZ-Cy5]
MTSGSGLAADMLVASATGTMLYARFALPVPCLQPNVPTPSPCPTEFTSTGKYTLNG